MTEPTAPRLSPLEEQRFGVRTARADHVTAASLDAVHAFVREHGVRLLIARCPTPDIAAAQALERGGALLMDTLVYFARRVGDGAPALPDESRAGAGLVIRASRPEDADSVARVAGDAFRDYLGHYHADARLDRGQSDATYVSWARRSCEVPGVADLVNVAELDGQVVGFQTLAARGDETEGVLNGVASAAQGRGIYRALMRRALEWTAERGARRMIISTQVNNVAPQVVWVRLGFEPERSYYTFHQWFD